MSRLTFGRRRLSAFAKGRRVAAPAHSSAQATGNSVTNNTDWNEQTCS
jgi:hypothetical protein